MTRRVKYLILFVSILAVFTLLFAISPGGMLDDNQMEGEPTPATYVNPPPQNAYSHIQIASFERDPPIPLQGRVSITVEGYDIQFHDVMFCVYSAEGREIYSRNLGDVETGERESYRNTSTINTTLQETPYFIVIDHPEIRDNSPPLVDSLVWNEERDRYVRHRNTTRLTRAFGFPRSIETGVCG